MAPHDHRSAIESCGIGIAMPGEAQITIRLPKDLLRRVQKLVSKLSKDPRHVNMTWGGKVRRSHVLRLALLRGIEALEADHE